MRYPRRRSAAAVVAILAAALLVGGDTGMATVRPPTAGPTPSIVGSAAAMDTYLSEATRMFRFSGAVLVARGTDVVLAKGYGLADTSIGTPNAPHTRYRIGSITKQFTALVILKLQELHKLTLTDRVCRYVPRCPTAWRPITWRSNTQLTFSCLVSRLPMAARWYTMSRAIPGLSLAHICLVSET